VNGSGSDGVVPGLGQGDRSGREGDLDDQAAAGSGAGRDGRAMRGGAHNGQAEAVAAVAAGWARTEPLEGLEHAVDIRGLDSFAGVGHR